MLELLAEREFALQSLVVEPEAAADEWDAGQSLEPASLDVLVIGSANANLFLIEHCLQHIASFEPRITLAGNANAGRFAAAAVVFDVIVVDYTPDSAGLICEITSGRQTPCILVTNLLTDDIKASAKAMGVTACLEKDELTSRLLETIIHQTDALSKARSH